MAESYATTRTGKTIGQLVTFDGDLSEVWFVAEWTGGAGRSFTSRVSGSRLGVRAQVMFCVPGELSTDSDPAPWFICSMPHHLQMISSIAVVKTPPEGAPIAYDIWSSPDGVDWTSIHTNSIAEGSYFSPESESFDPTFVEHNHLLRLAVGGAGTSVPGSDLTVSLRVRPLSHPYTP